MKHLGRKLAVPVVGLAMAGGGFALLANNNVAVSYAGEGVQQIAGFTVTNVHYQYTTEKEGTKATYIATVTFTLNHPASSVSAVVHPKGGYTFHYNNCVADPTSDLNPFVQGNPHFAANTFTCYTTFDGPATVPAVKATSNALVTVSNLNAAPLGGTDTVSVSAAQ